VIGELRDDDRSEQARSGGGSFDRFGRQGRSGELGIVARVFASSTGVTDTHRFADEDTGGPVIVASGGFAESDPHTKSAAARAEFLGVGEIEDDAFDGQFGGDAATTVPASPDRRGRFGRGR